MSAHTVEKITSKFDDGSAVISYRLDEDASTVTVLVTDANGESAAIEVGEDQAREICRWLTYAADEITRR